MGSDLNLGDLGPGWEQAERALADLQTDLSRTVPNAPKLILLWCEAGDDDEWPWVQEPGGRWAYIGKAVDWYYGADGGFELPRDYADAVSEIGGDLSDAIADTLLGYYAYRPHCPEDDHPLSVGVDPDRRCWWICHDRDHTVAEVGHLPRSGARS